MKTQRVFVSPKRGNARFMKGNTMAIGPVGVQEEGGKEKRERKPKTGNTDGWELSYLAATREAEKFPVGSSDEKCYNTLDTKQWLLQHARQEKKKQQQKPSPIDITSVGLEIDALSLIQQHRTRGGKRQTASPPQECEARTPRSTNPGRKKRNKSIHVDVGQARFSQQA
ncbi:hypothetical protein PoB_004209200 [Plakobranchus ocellatus]|uniref:Uncharacterized protein n=1 Tax=Plakobranchus ocellatus TaxID=259542 RepID=A0AAV4B8Y2_9GAST|nr:hypothetical protein PoB_004209200 [Plakobranchus ocellatus]